MATKSSQTQSKSFFRRLLDGLWRLIRLLLIILVLVVLAVGIYYGAKIGYETIVLPLNATIARVDKLEEAQQEEQKNVTAQLTERDERITELETLLTKQKGDMRSQDAKIISQQGELESLTTLTSQIEELHDNLKTTNSQFETIEEELADLQNQAKTLQATTERLGDTDEATNSDLDKLNDGIKVLQEGASNTSTTLGRLQQGRLLLHAQANILNAQRELERRNVGSANDYLQRAEVSLNVAAESMEESQQPAIALVLTRLDQALERLEIDPFSASSDLQAVWRALDSVILGELSVGLPLPAEIPDPAPQAQEAEDAADAQEEQAQEAEEEQDAQEAQEEQDAQEAQDAAEAEEEEAQGAEDAAGAEEEQAQEAEESSP
ncbi:MAG: hypothetical protein ACPGWR_30865 [Ardenticatenaceae bacterium]